MGQICSSSMGICSAQRTASARGSRAHTRSWANAAILVPVLAQFAVLVPGAAQSQYIGASISVAPGACLYFWELLVFTPTGLNVAWNALATIQSLNASQVGTSAAYGNDLIARPYEVGFGGGYIDSACSTAFGDTWQVTWAQPQQISHVFFINRADSPANAQNIVRGRGVITLLGPNGVGSTGALAVSASVVTRLTFLPGLWPVVPDLSNASVAAQQAVSI